jgi:hypothetical protein
MGGSGYMATASTDTFSLVRDTVQVFHILRDTLVVEHATDWSKWITAASSVIAALLGAFAGQWIARRSARAQQQQDRQERLEERNQERADRQWTSARLARRYLLFSRDQLRAVDPTAPNIGPAHWEYWMGNIGDFDEIKARMIELQNDELEEQIYRWNAKTMDDLRELRDIRTLSEPAYMERYGTNDLAQRPFRLEALRAAFKADADEADEIAKALGPYLAREHSRRAPDGEG